MDKLQQEGAENVDRKHEEIRMINDRYYFSNTLEFSDLHNLTY